MLKQLKKKKINKIHIPQTEIEQIICGACNHVRKETETNPEWQCPCCGAAYAKVNAKAETEQVSRQELRRKNHDYLNRKKHEENLSRSPAEQSGTALKGMLMGAATFISGLASTSGCRAVAANPVVQTIGGLIFVAALIYGVVKFLA